MMNPRSTEHDFGGAPFWQSQIQSSVGRLILCVFLVLSASLSAQGSEIHTAVTKGNLNKVVMLLNSHPEQLESKDDLGRTPLYLAVAKNQVEIAALLLANGADVDASDALGHTPLIQAMWGLNHDKMVRLLLAKGASVNLCDNGNMTALAYAVKQGQLDDARILIANDANVNFESGMTPLYFAVIGHHREMVELLLANGADVNHRIGGRTVLRLAMIDDYLTHQFSDPKIVALIKQYGGHE